MEKTWERWQIVDRIQHYTLHFADDQVIAQDREYLECLPRKTKHIRSRVLQKGNKIFQDRRARKFGGIRNRR